MACWMRKRVIPAYDFLNISLPSLNAESQYYAEAESKAKVSSKVNVMNIQWL